MANQDTIWVYIDEMIVSYNRQGRCATADNYGKAMRCLQRYCQQDNLKFQDITEEFVNGFNAYLTSNGIQKSTISFYNRALRSLYNKAAKEGLVKNAHPFDGAYTKVIAKLSPVNKIKNEHGEQVNLEDMSREELMRQCQTLQRKYNSLVGKITAIVGA